MYNIITHGSQVLRHADQGSFELEYFSALSRIRYRMHADSR